MIGLVMMSYSTAMMFDAFIDAHREIVRQKRLLERAGLFASFAALCGPVGNALGYKEWGRLVRGVRPGADEDEVRSPNQPTDSYRLE